ncbi:hypothetical protein RAN3_1869 [plant metagenome]|uniref:Uncharacterized protein n=1 Tax=plant metagenome TaxID=1297885 RepID=A0A484VE72_9ZZZZ
MALTNFDTWLSGQLEQGLVDIKFAVVPGKDVSSEAVQGEFLATEMAIQAGLIKDAPKPQSAVPEGIMDVLKNVTFH